MPACQTVPEWIVVAEALTGIYNESAVARRELDTNGKKHLVKQLAQTVDVREALIYQICLSRSTKEARFRWPGLLPIYITRLIHQMSCNDQRPRRLLSIGK